MRYHVTVRSISETIYEVEAEDERQARLAVGDTEPVSTETHDAGVTVTEVLDELF